MDQCKRLGRCLKALILIIALVLLNAPDANAKGAGSDSIRVFGEVSDLFTGDIIEKGRVTVVNERDSVLLVDSIHPPHKQYWGTWGWDIPAQYEFKLPKAGNYRIMFDVDGYTMEYQDLRIPEKEFHKPTKEWMQKYKLRRLPKEHVLNGVEVRATRIKMVVKGDTVEYNADAFELAEGSMLDKLIEAMPGMELRENGEIYNNGKKVESLLVNGKDFFQGDPKVALENLPAYTVKKVQVYRKDDDGAYMISDSLKREKMKKLVVDVKLKKEYSKGWMWTADLAYGTNDRWMSKVFGLYFSDSWKFLLWSNFNNLNDQSTANANGDWWGWNSENGLYRIKKGGYTIAYNKEDACDFYQWMHVSHDNSNTENKTTSTTYLTSGDTYSRSRSNSASSNTRIEFGSHLNLHKKAYFMSFRPLNLNYSRSRNTGTSLSATFDSDPMDAYRTASLDSLYLPVGSQRLEQMLLNAVTNQTLGTTRSFSINTDGEGFFHSPLFGNDVRFNLRGGYGKNDTDAFSHYLLNNRQAGNKEYQNLYTPSPTRNYSFEGSMDYNIDLKEECFVEFSYSYSQNFDKNNSSRYRLDSLPGWGEAGQHLIGELPSVRDSMLRVLDVRNSYHRTNLTRKHEMSVSTRFNIYKKWAGEITLPIAIQNRTVYDNRNNNAQRRKQNTTFFDPRISINRWEHGEGGKMSSTSLDYSFSHNAPDVSSLLDITDDTNPLFVSKGNPYLSNSQSHNINFHTGYSNAKHMQNYNMDCGWNVTRNSVASATTYNRSTGVTTYQPLNISGNWKLNASGNYERNIDKKDRLLLRNRLTFNYDHNVDYISDSYSEEGMPERSTVNNYTVGNHFTLAYTYKKYRVEGFANANWKMQNSERANFQRVSAVDWQCGLSSHGPIVWGLEYNTSLRCYFRRGYNDASMNDEQFVWNLSLSRSFLKGKKLTLRLETRDLLGQLSNVRTTINAQGRTETWYNAVPRYTMLHVVYKFNTMGEKKGKSHPTWGGL